MLRFSAEEVRDAASVVDYRPISVYFVHDQSVALCSRISSCASIVLVIEEVSDKLFVIALL